MDMYMLMRLLNDELIGNKWFIALNLFSFVDFWLIYLFDMSLVGWMKGGSHCQGNYPYLLAR